MNLRRGFFPLVLLLLISSQSFALIGTGVHWGFDFSTEMTPNEQDEVFTNKDLNNLSGPLNTVFSAVDTTVPFMYISRTGFEKTPINFGGKVFLNPKLLPLEFELSMNMGIWQYDGSINYLSGADTTGGELSLTYDEKPVTLESISGMKYFGVNKTPYGKFHFDATVKKTFDMVPLIKPSIGAGLSAHFATPVLSSELVANAMNFSDNINDIDFTTLDFSSPETYKKIMEKITDGAKKPKTGMHFLVGLKVKPPIIPLAVYADGKYMLLFNDIEDGVGVSTKGLLLNIGVMFTI